MFTGIIEEVGFVERVTQGAKSARLCIKADAVLAGTRIGDSICTSGVCLTVTGLEGNRFEADVMGETMRRSKLGSLRAGSRVNLERAMPLNGRFGGHIVGGHIDGTGKINRLSGKITRYGWNYRRKFAAPLYVGKGSVAVDGVS